MKLVIFTLDSIFALIIAVSGIALLSYFFYLPQTSTVLSYSSAAAILQNLLTSRVADLAGSNPLYSNLTYQANANNETWDQYIKDVGSNAGNSHGPLSPSISFTSTPATIASTPVIDYGNYYYRAGGILYSISATTGASIWSKNVISAGSIPYITPGKLIYANNTNLTAYNPITNTIIWSTNVVALTATSQYFIYNNKLYVGGTIGATQGIFAYYLNNGTQAWSYSLGNTPNYIQIDGGSIVAVSQGAGNIALLQDFGNSANVIWSKSQTLTSYGVSISNTNKIIAFISGSSANAINIDGTTASGFPIPIVTAPTDPVVYNNVVYYQTGNGLTAVAINGLQLWSYAAPASFGAPVTYTIPVISDKLVYTAWANGYVSANNVSTGQYVWSTKLGTGTPYINALAYGRLYVQFVPSSGPSQIYAYGACNTGGTTSSVLALAATMYLNGQGSCADALVNGVAPMSNYSIFLNNTFAPGMGVIKFDGSSTTLQNPTKAILNNLQTFTVTGWVYVNAYNPSQSDVYSEGQPAQTLVMQISNAGALSMSAWSTNTPGNWQTYLTSLTVPLKKWTFVAYSLSVGGTRGTFIQYLNGQSQSGAGQPESSGPTSYTGIGYNVGNSVSQNAQYLNGYLANLQIYNSTLTSTQVAQLYRSGIQGAPLKNAGLQAWYPLAGDTNDYSGLGNTAYPLNAIYVPSNYLPLGYLNSYQVSSSGVAMPITNYTTGLTKLYKVNVVAWR